MNCETCPSSCAAAHPGREHATTLTDFLLARIAEDEYDARTRSLGRGWRKQWLAECEAKRRIIALEGTRTAEAMRTIPDGLRVLNPDGSPIMYALALPYADHPDYREDWRP